MSRCLGQKLHAIGRKVEKLQNSTPPLALDGFRHLQNVASLLRSLRKRCGKYREKTLTFSGNQGVTNGI